MRRVTLLLALVALVVPTAALAQTVRVKGPKAVLAGGEVKAEVAMAAADGRPVAFRIPFGGVRFTDHAGDLEVRCLRAMKMKKRGERQENRGERQERQQGEPKRRTQADGEGAKGCRGGALVRGSKFTAHAKGPLVGILVPEGAAASITAKRLKVRGADRGESEPEEELSDVDESDAIEELEQALAELEDE